VDPAGGAESAYLAVIAASVLLAVGFLAPWPAVELGLGATLAAAAVWALPPGPTRGAAVVLVLVTTVAVAAGRALLHGESDPQGIETFFKPPLSRRTGGEAGREGVGGVRAGGVLIPLALALQFLLRGDLLFEPAFSFRTLVALIGLPIAGAVAVSLLSRRHGAVALIAGATAVALAPGFNVAATLSLLALAAGDSLRREDLGRPAKLLALFVLLAPIAWEPGPGLAAAVCGLGLWRPGIALALAVPVAAGLGWVSGISWEGMASQLVWLPLLIPAAVAPERDRLPRVLTAALAAATVPQIPDLSVLAAPLGLAALSIRRDCAVAIPQGVWGGALLGGTALLASYPWLREEPLAGVLSLLGLPAGPALALAVVAVFLALAGAGVWMGRGWGEPLRSLRLAGLAAACLALALLLGVPAPGRQLLAPEVPVVLDAGHPVWEAGIPGQAVRAVVVESNLANGAALPLGTPVATVRLRDPAGRSVGWTLRAGEHTGEWAARRPDVARLGARTPNAWVSWVAGDFLAQRYRSRWRLEKPDRFVQLRVERAAGAPPDLALALYQLEVRR
jgi:hypothetical protein